jgi:hypothetical protein
MTAARWRVVGVTGLAVLLRAPRVAARWHEDAWLYSAYPAEVRHALQSGDLVGLLTTFTGLHPPAWPVLHSLTEWLSPRPLWWLLESGLLSVGAVVLLARRSPLAGLVLATAPVAVHYSVEVNQYALLTFALAGLWSTDARAGDGVHRSLVAWGWLAGWTHLLGAFAALLAVLTLPASQRWRSLVALLVGFLPLAPGVLLALSADSTFTQPPLEAALVLSDLLGRFGGLGLLLPVLALVSASKAPRLAVGWLGASAVWVGFVGLRVAAPHQFPYLLTVLPPLALAVAHLPRAWRFVVPLAVLQSGWQLAFDGMRGNALYTDISAADRSVDHALAALQAPWTCPGLTLDPTCSGDALVLLRPPGRNDDDKTRTSAVLWRIKPWWSAPAIHLPQLPPGSPDHRYGQPRLVSLPQGRFAVYVHDHVRPTLVEPFEQHARALLVVSDVGPESSVLQDAAKLLQQPPQKVGQDYLFESP